MLDARSFHDPNPPTPAFSETHDWIKYYLVSHRLSPPSYRYAYLLWIFMTFCVLAYGLVRLFAKESRSAPMAMWHKWAIRRPALFRRKAPIVRRGTLRNPSDPNAAQRVAKPTVAPTPAWWMPKFSPLPFHGEMAALVILAVGLVLASVLGADYIKPTTTTFDLSHSKRDDIVSLEATDISRRDYTIVPVTPPNYTISKAWWTAGGRTGLIAFALFPLCVTAALKSPPFAIFSLRFPTQTYSDKLTWLHRWTGRFIYILTVAHVALWSVQLARDRREGINGGGIVWVYAFSYPKFIFGILAFIFMTLLVMLSFPAFRRSDFELFYALHIFLVPATLIFSSLHFPPLGPWCWSALALWAMERAWRFVKSVWVNGSPLDEKVPKLPIPPQPYPLPPTRQSTISARDNLRRDSYGFAPSPSGKGFREIYPPDSAMSADSTTRFTFPPPPPQNSGIDPSAYIPPGCGRAEMLPGRTIRLTVRPQHRLEYSPGQYAFLTFPILSRFTGHPFTIVSSKDDSSSNDLEGGNPKPNFKSQSQLLEFIIRARQGLTLDLWNHLNQTRQVDARGQYIPSLMRVRVDGSYGSAVKLKWERYGSVLIVVGGSGVAFGLSVLDHVCRQMRDADSRFRDAGLGREATAGVTKGASGVGSLFGRRTEEDQVMTTRVRFVWLVREYSHLMWCASQLRRLVQMVPPDMLQIDIFVTNFAPSASHALRPKRPLERMPTEGSLIPPHPKFAANARPSHSQRSSSRGSSADGSEDTDSAWSSDDSLVDLSYAGRRSRNGGASSPNRHRQRDVDGSVYQGIYDDSEEDDLGEGRNVVVGLTNFDGEEDEREPEESWFSARVKKQGQHVRKKTLVDIEAHQNPLPRSQNAAPIIGPPRRRPHNELELTGDISDSVTAGILFDDEPVKLRRPTSPPTITSPKPPSRPGSPSVGAPADPRIQQLRLDTQVSVHSPLSPQYQPSPSSPSPNHPVLPSRIAPRGHARRLSTRISVAESLYSQYGGEPSPTADSSFEHHQRSDSASLRELLSASEAHLPNRRDGGVGALDYLFNLSAQEREDMGYIAALARPGRPRLDKILSSEVERSTGAIAVACCGPSSLDSVVRRLVSLQINPARIRKGDQRGFITFYNEEFSF